MNIFQLLFGGLQKLQKLKRSNSNAKDFKNSTASENMSDKKITHEKWRPGKFVAGNKKDMNAWQQIDANKAQFEADCFLVNMMINEVCGNPREKGKSRK